MLLVWAGSVIEGVAEGCSLSQAIGSLRAVREQQGRGSLGRVPVHVTGMLSMSMQAANESKSPGTATCASLSSFTALHIS